MTKVPNPYLEDSLADRAVVFRRGEGKILKIKGGKIALKVTSDLSNDQLGIYEISLEPGVVGAELHYHRFMDETFMVNEGRLTVRHGQTEVEAQAGTLVYIPRFTPHGFANKSDQEVLVTLIFNPAQKREGFFYGLERILNNDSMNQEEFLALYAKYDSYPVNEAGK